MRKMRTCALVDYAEKCREISKIIEIKLHPVMESRDILYYIPPRISYFYLIFITYFRYRLIFWRNKYLFLTCSKINKDFPIFFSIFQHFSTYSNIFQHIPTYSNIFQHILKTQFLTYFNLFQHIPTYSEKTFFNIFQHILTYSNILKPVFNREN